jgi:uncharacterized membrane protein
MKTRIITAIGCLALLADLGAQAHYKSGAANFATLTVLPSLSGSPSEALAIDEAGTVIVGSSWDRFGLLHAVKWTLQNGSWVITTLPYSVNATSDIARSVNHLGVGAGNDFPATTSHPMIWPAGGGFVALGCGDDVAAATVYAISSNGFLVVGQEGGAASVWPQPGDCRIDLPPLADGASAGARAVNGDGRIVGGAAALVPDGPGVPVQWANIDGQWQIQQLDYRQGVVFGANAIGDLGGSVVNTCALPNGCNSAVIWYAAGGVRQLGTLGGEHSWIRDLNSNGEAVGLSTSRRLGNTGFFWSESTGMLELPVKGRATAANGISDVRADGTRLVVGMDSQGEAVVWVVRPF